MSYADTGFRFGDGSMVDMATPPSRAERKKEELRREIIDTAFECFAESGYHATGIADIAERLGIGHGTFYRYFRNKREILDCVVDDLVGRITAALASDPPDVPSTLEEFREQSVRLGDSLSNALFADPRIPRMLLLEATGVDAELTARMFELLESTVNLTAAFLQHGVDEEYLRGDLDVEHTARAINGMAIASALYGSRGHGEARMKNLNTAIQRLMFDGMRRHS